MSLLKYLGIKRTEDFFEEFKETRQALQRIVDNDLHPCDGAEADREKYVWVKEGSRLTLRDFNKIKKAISLLTPNGGWCYVPPQIQGYLDGIRRREKFYSQFYWDAENNRKVQVNDE